MARRRVARPVGFVIAASLAIAALLAVSPPAFAHVRASILAADKAESTPPVPGPVVLIGTAGVRWSEIDASRTRTLWSLLEHGATGSIAARSLGAYSCPVDGWLAVSAGRLAVDDRNPAGPPCVRPDAVTTGEAIPRWYDYINRASQDQRDAVPGLLGSALAAGEVSVAAIGPGAAIATATTSGVPLGTAQPAPDDPVELGRAVGAAARQSALVVVDIGALTDQSLTVSDGGGLLGRVDAKVAAVLAALPDDSTVLVMSLADDGTEPHLQAALAIGPGRYEPYEKGLLGSRSTRQPGLLQTTDLTPTLLSLLAVPAPDTLVGSPVTRLVESPTGRADRLQGLRDFDEAAQAVQASVTKFGAGLVAGHLLAYAGSWLALRRRWGGELARRRLLRGLSWAGVLLASVPVATYPANLVPWWRSPAPFATLMAAVLAGAAIVTLVAKLGPWRRDLLGPMGVVAGITTLVLTVDVLTGSRLMISSLLGLQPLVAGRFYGLGNVAFALFATGALLAACALADRLLSTCHRAAALASVLVIGLVATLVDGTPGLGSDFGGPLAIIPGFAVLTFFVAQLPASWRSALGVAVGTVGVVAALSVLDWLRPPDQRTHLGRFVEAIVNGETWQVVGRKLEQNVGILVGSPYGLLIPVVAVVLGVAVVRPGRMRVGILQRVYGRSPVLRPGLLGLLVLLALGFAVNDSGTAVPAVSFALVVPLVVSVCATALLLESTARHAR